MSGEAADLNIGWHTRRGKGVFRYIDGKVDGKVNGNPALMKSMKERRRCMQKGNGNVLTLGVEGSRAGAASAPRSGSPRTAHRPRPCRRDAS